MAPPDELVAALREQSGDALRSVARYHRDGYELLYVREDVDARYEEAEVEQIYQDVVLQTMTRDYFESLFDAGAYECSALGFEEAMMFQFVREEFEGLFVSVDKDAPIQLGPFVETCKEYA